MIIRSYISKNPSLSIPLKKKSLLLLVIQKSKVYYNYNILINNLGIKDLLPNILKQLGPKQFSFIKDYAETLKSGETENKKEDEQAPELVEDFEEVSKQD